MCLNRNPGKKNYSAFFPCSTGCVALLGPALSFSCLFFLPTFGVLVWVRAWTSSDPRGLPLFFPRRPDLTLGRCLTRTGARCSLLSRCCVLTPAMARCSLLLFCSPSQNERSVSFRRRVGGAGKAWWLGGRIWLAATCRVGKASRHITLSLHPRSTGSADDQLHNF